MDIKLIKSEFENFKKYYDKKNIKSSIACLNLILKENPNEVKAIYYLGTIYLENKNFAEAKKYYIKYIKLYPNNLYVHFNLGLANYNLGELEDSIKNFKNVLKIDNNHLESINTIANIYRESDNLDKAKVYYEKCLSIDPNKKKVFLGYSRLLLKLNDHKKGLKYLYAATGIIRFNKDKVELI